MRIFLLAYSCPNEGEAYSRVFACTLMYLKREVIKL